MRIPALLLLFAITATAQSKGEPPKPLRLEVPKAKRALSGHVQEILDRLPAFHDKERCLEIDELVDPRREFEWGAEGLYWDVVLSLANAATLEVDETWTQYVKLVPPASSLRHPRVDGHVLSGIREYRDSNPGERLTQAVFVLAPYLDLAGCTAKSPGVEYDPASPEPHESVGEAYGMRLPASVSRLTIGWQAYIYLKTSLETIPARIGARVKSGEGEIEIIDIREQTGGRSGKQTVFFWDVTNLGTAGTRLFLEDGTEAQEEAGEGQGEYKDKVIVMHERTAFARKESNPKELRVRVIHEEADFEISRSFDRKELALPGRHDLVSGPIFWTRPPKDGARVDTGAVRADGWGARTGGICLSPSEETGSLEGFQEITGWDRPIALEKPKGLDLRYHVFGLDVGDWFVWTETGNWIDLRRVPVPGGQPDGDVVIALNHAASVVVHAEGDHAQFLPLDDKGQRIPGDDGPSVWLEKKREGGFSGEGLKPGDYLLKCGETERKVTLHEGENSIELR